ncbi:AAA family ATPase [Mycolicibacterium nivoides]|uniref:AAA family ATPase n=1 Tax=Mycolicibacterium nivoides TaxID=2487344 RepID=UPI000F5BF547|nr:AAA family ATPase [Mycolicibacterium nivoides]
MMAYPANLANLTHDTPATAARMDYLGATAAGTHTAEELAALSRLADEADAVIYTPVTAPAEPSSAAPPDTLAAWRPYIPEHINQSFAPVEGSACACPNNGKVALHVEGCSQGVAGKAQAIDTDFCAEYDLPLNAPIDPVVLGAALRGITVQGLADVMLWEAEDREFAAVLQRDRTPEELAVRAANREAYDRDPAVREEFDRDQAESEAAEEEADALFETLRKRMSVEAYDQLFDDLDVSDPDAVLSRLRAEVAALPDVADAASVPPAPTEAFTVPPAPGATVPTAPTAGAAPIPELVPLTPEEAVLAEAMNARLIEQTTLTTDLAAYLRRMPDDDAVQAEIKALMGMTLADRAEAIEAAKTGQLTRLGLRAAYLSAMAPGSKQNWLRLREGAAAAWATTDLEPLSDADLDRLLDAEPPTPTIGNGLFYDRGLHVLAGPGGCGKTWVALAACVTSVPAVHVGDAAGGPAAVYLDLDQNLELYPRLRDLGLSRTAMKRREVVAMNVGALAAERGEGTVACLRSIIDGLTETPPRVVIIDSLTRVMAESGEDSNDSDGITRVLNMLNRLAAVCCVIVLDHVGHAEPDRPSGAAAKINAARVVLTMKPIESDADDYPNTVAAAVVVRTKDRDGGMRRHLAPGDRAPRPDLGLVTVDRDEENSGHTEVRFIPASTVAAAKERRESDEGVAVAHEAHDAILTAVRGAKEALSSNRIEELVWPLFASRKGFTKADFRAVIRHMTDTSMELVADGSGRGGGKRYTAAE